MQITGLKLVGFKSFVDPSEVQIETGLTGIVGPNGCGKSNVLESLRWVMGASSAKALRGIGTPEARWALLKAIEQEPKGREREALEQILATFSH